MFPESDLLPLSGLQHLVFCERQWALIHLEQLWAENRLTAEGAELHAKAHEGQPETRPLARIVRSLPLRSLRLGIAGMCDIVEFPADGGPPFPIEYKRGKPKHTACDAVQVCAQALCLEEMLGVSIPEGAIFYGEIRHRHPVPFDAALRAQTEAAAARMHELFRASATPPAVFFKGCRSCSLLDLCLPKPLAAAPSVDRFMAQQIRSAREDP